MKAMTFVGYLSLLRDKICSGIRWRINAWADRVGVRHVVNRQPSYKLPNNRYDAARYWGDRHAKYRGGFRGVGNVGLTEEENIQDYLRAAGTMAEQLRAVRCNPRGKSMLDIGCGNGFWTGVFREWGVAAYTGIDITDALFKGLRHRHPRFDFICGDFTQMPLSGKFDLITMIDVTQHVTDDGQLARMLGRVPSVLSSDGVFVVTFWNEQRPQENFYETFRPFDFYVQTLSGMIHTEPLRFRDKFIAAFQLPGRRPDTSITAPLPPQSARRIAEEILPA